MYKKENPMKASGLYTKIFINHLFICHGINRLKRVLNKVKNFFTSSVIMGSVVSNKKSVYTLAVFH